MEEKEITIISIIDSEFDNLSINNLINELKKIPQYDFKNTRTFILKLFRDIDTSLKNSKNKIKKYFQGLKSQNDQIIKKIYFQSRNKPLISKYNTKESTNLTNIKDNSFFQTQTANDYKNYENIESIKNLKSSEENSVKEYDDIFNKNIIEMKYFSGNNGIKNPLKFKKKINLGNKSLSEFKIKKKKKICFNDFNKDSNMTNLNLYKIYNQAHNNKNNSNISNNKSNSIKRNKIEISFNNIDNSKENDYYSNIKIIKQLNNTKKKIPSYDKKNIKKNNMKLMINNNSKDKKENIISYHNNDKSINNNKIIDIQIKSYTNEKNTKEIKNPFKNANNNNINNNTPFENINNNTIIQNNYNNEFIDTNNINNNKENICQKLANEIIYFIDNMKDLQKNIINKNPNIKEMKYNFEKQKYLLYQKSLKLSKISDNENEDKDLNIKDNKKYEISKNFSFFLKKSINNDINKNNNNNITNIENTKELNMSITNLRKTIEDIKNNSQFLAEQLKSEITILNNKLKEKNEKEKEYEQYIFQNLNSIIQIYKLLFPHCLKQYDFLTSIENESHSSRNSSEKKFNWYINEITKFIDILINKNSNNSNNNNNNILQNISNINNNNINICQKNKKEENIIDINEIKNELLKNILEIMTWINPYISKDKNNTNINIAKQIETNFEQNKMKEAFDLFKLKIKEIITLIDNLKIKIKKRENEKNKINNSNNKNNIISCDDDEDNLDKNNFLQLNSTLLGIQNDLIQKIENKQEEIEKIKKDLKNSIQLNNEFMNMAKNQKGQDVNIFAEKYKYLLDLFNSEQEKVKFLQNEYVNLLSGLSNYVNNGNEIIIELKKMWNLNPIIKTNFEIAEPEFPEIDPINETDLLTENS